MIREGWIDSEKIDQLDAHGERFFLRLCLRADDFGRYFANPQLLKSNLFPLREDVRSTDIPRWLAACEKTGLIRCYEVSGKRFLEIQRFDQRLRAAHSKFPVPPSDHCQTNGGHVSDIRPTCDRPPRSEAEAEAEAEEETESKTNVGLWHKSDLQRRAEKLFNRRESTVWDGKEMKAWNAARRAIEATSDEEWRLVEWLYSLPSDEKHYRRTSLPTLLNNWNAEIDRARDYQGKRSAVLAPAVSWQRPATTQAEHDAGF